MDEQTVIIQENYERYEMIYLSAFAKTECQHYAQRDSLMLTLHLAFLEEKSFKFCHGFLEKMSTSLFTA